MKILPILVIALVVLGVAVVLWKRHYSTKGTLRRVKESTTETVKETPMVSGTSSPSIVASEYEYVQDVLEDPVTDDLPMTDFAFENLVVGEGKTPDAETSMTKTTAAETAYKVVRCSLASGYAIKWSGRYFTVNEDGTTSWSMQKQEPASCFEIKPGFCGDSGAFVMLRSMLNGHFLRVSGTTNKVIAIDSPTSNNAKQYCWLFRNTQKNAKLPCGSMYRPEYGRVVTIPCTIIKDPPPGQTCMSATDGYKADCCGRHPNDQTCRSIFIREVVGRTLAEAATYIKTRFPQYTILKCARGDDCEKAKPFPLPKPDTIVLVYDPRLGTVVKPAYRFI